MNTPSEETPEGGKQRRKSIDTSGSLNGGSGGGRNVGGGKTRRNSIGITSSRKSIGEEGNIVPNYLRASTGSCHDFCKYGKKHEHSKSAIPIKFKRSTVVNKEKVTKTVVPVERKQTIKDLKIQAPVESTKKDVSFPSKKSQVLSTNGKAKENKLKMVNPDGSNGGIKKKDITTVKKTGIAPIKKGTGIELQSPKASFSKAASLKGIKSRTVKQVSPLKDQNRMRKTELKKTTSDKIQTKPETMEFEEFIHPSPTLINGPDLLEKESMIMIKDSVFESSKLFPEKELLEESSMAPPVFESSQSLSDKEVLEEDSQIAPPVSESSQSFYDDEVLEDESEFTDEELDEEVISGEESESFDDEKLIATENNKIPRKGRVVISEDKDDDGVKLRFRRGKILDLQSDNNGPRRLKFRRRVIEGNEEKQRFITRRTFEKKNEKEKDHSTPGHESVVLKHQGEQGKKDAQGLFNNVIEETASKLVETRKSKVKALVGAFETVISLQDGKP